MKFKTDTHVYHKDCVANIVSGNDPAKAFCKASHKGTHSPTGAAPLLSFALPAAPAPLPVLYCVFTGYTLCAIIANMSSSILLFSSRIMDAVAGSSCCMYTRGRTHIHICTHTDDQGERILSSLEFTTEHTRQHTHAHAARLEHHLCTSTRCGKYRVHTGYIQGTADTAGSQHSRHFIRTTLNTVQKG